MATFENLNINGIPHFHIRMSITELGNMMSDPFTYMANNAPAGSPALTPNRPVLYEIFTYSAYDGVTSPPNPCDGPTPNGTGWACVCTPASMVTTANLFRVYFMRYGTSGTMNQPPPP
jgi:hypothetical protein